MGLILVIAGFSTEQECRDYLRELRWPDGVECPRCGTYIIRHIATRDTYACLFCDYVFSVTAGTAFHRTRVPLVKWFAAIYLLCESKKGISSNQLHRMLGVTYNTAWYMSHRIRNAIYQAELSILGGVVEVDETWVGGRTKGLGKGRTKKNIVVGILERGLMGGLVMRVVRNRRKRTLGRFIRRYSDPDDIYTDDWVGYRGIATATVNHSIREYAKRIGGKLIHVNTIENVWSLLKRSIIGTFHSVSLKHLNRYLDELAWKVKHRHTSDLFESTLREMMRAEHISYEELTG